MTMSQITGVRVRFAPAPTGYLHVGSARTALYNWLFARHHRGKFLLRIEDTDLQRSSREMVRIINDSLRWLGLNWDEDLYFQSPRISLYQEAVQQLLESNQAYYCYCSPELLARKREKAMNDRRDWKYDRTCLALSPPERENLERRGVPRSVRLFVPEGKTAFQDMISGRIVRDNREIDDLIILRSGGGPTYNLACVVDDHEMGITHVIRGTDHISNTPKQLLLYKALGFAPPKFAHLPLILSEDRSKLSKRHAAISVTEYRDKGYLPEVFVNFLALLGWSPGDDREILSREELVDSFSLERVNKSGAIFDIKKLDWMNGHYINLLSDEEALEAALPFLVGKGLISEVVTRERKEWLLKVVALLKPRARRLIDFAELGRYFFTDDFDYDSKAVTKHFSESGVIGRLGRLRSRLSKLKDFSKEAVENCLRTTADQLGMKAAAFIHPTRVAVTGLQEGPGLFEVLELLGKKKTLTRLDKAIDYIKTEMPQPPIRPT